MEYFLFFTVSVPGIVYSICWLIDRKDQRRFCKNATSAQAKLYIQILASSKKSDLSIITGLRKNEKLVDKDIMKAA